MTTIGTRDVTRVPWFGSFFNPIINRVLGAGLPFGPNVMLTVLGRTSGQPRTVPVALLRHGGRRYVQSAYGEVHWVHNLRAAGEAVLAKGRLREDVIAIELTPEEAAPILRDALAPFLRVPVLGAVLRRQFLLPADATLADFVAEARRNHPTFELQPKA
jgi:deazaflavin-dependent oxidoreductase (nitroreductase family)